MPRRFLSPAGVGLTTGLAALTVLGAAPAPAQFGGLQAPSAGVLCDNLRRSCFDDRGASLNWTQRLYGPAAAQQLAAQLSGRPPLQDIQLSTGALCDLRARLCWDDGNRRRQVSRSLSQQLFGSSAGGGGWNPGGSGANVTRDRARCTLLQQTRTLYDGRCSLRTIRDGGLVRYVVSTPDGRRFDFSNLRGRLQVTDATGNWPVEFIDHGFTGVFRWQAMTLMATREHSGLRSANAGADQFMDGLFGSP
ncbi:MAG: YcgJ family protein [Cyanobacteriota bacterium]|nr:YcgJ family protein [Cyanobacteriota bacterium]